MTIPTGGATDRADATMDADTVRREVRAWIDRHFDRDLSLRAWLELLADSGWAKPTWPVEWFGKGLPTDLAAIAYAELAKAGAPGPPAGLGSMLAAPTIIAHGSDDLKRRLRARHPDRRSCLVPAVQRARSGLGPGGPAGTSRARRRRVRGQRAEGVDVGRADRRLRHADRPYRSRRARSIAASPTSRSTCSQPGVEVRPLRQITGESSFAEVFLDRTSACRRATSSARSTSGWKVAVATLGNERAGLGAGSGIDPRVTAPADRASARSSRSPWASSSPPRRRGEPGGTGGAAMIGRGVTPLIELARRLGRDRDAAVSQQIVRLYTLARLNAWNGLRGRASVQAGGKAGGETSIGKLDGLAHRAPVARHRVRDQRRARHARGLRRLRSRERSPCRCSRRPGPAIYGGTDQIQRNIIGERVLGLARRARLVQGACRSGS